MGKVDRSTRRHLSLNMVGWCGVWGGGLCERELGVPVNLQGGVKDRSSRDISSSPVTPGTYADMR